MLRALRKEIYFPNWRRTKTSSIITIWDPNNIQKQTPYSHLRESTNTQILVFKIWFWWNWFCLFFYRLHPWVFHHVFVSWFSNCLMKPRSRNTCRWVTVLLRFHSASLFFLFIKYVHSLTKPNIDSWSNRNLFGDLQRQVHKNILFRPYSDHVGSLLEEIVKSDWLA